MAQRKITENGELLVNGVSVKLKGMNRHDSNAAGKANADNAEWIEPCVIRLKRMVERDKNSPCVLFWSLGNESRFGRVHIEMASWLKSRDNSRPIHYVGASHWQSNDILKVKPKRSTDLQINKE